MYIRIKISMFGPHTACTARDRAWYDTEYESPSLTFGAERIVLKEPRCHTHAQRWKGSPYLEEMAGDRTEDLGV